MRVVCVTVTGAGRELAARLPYEHVHGEAAATVRSRWSEVDAFVLVLAVGAAVRMVAPLLEGKATDPAVVCVDDAGAFAVAVLGGHGGGANALAREVAALIGAEPVVTTATDARGLAAIDLAPGLVAEGDVSGVTAALLDGRPVVLENDLGWPAPLALAAQLASDPDSGDGVAPARIVLSDRLEGGGDGVAMLRPPSLVAGIGVSTDVPEADIAALLQETLAEAGLARASLSVVATIDRRRNDPGIVGLGLPIVAFGAEDLADVDVPTPSDVVAKAVGTPSVAEAAALLAAGPGATLVVPKQTRPRATVAIARRKPCGALAIVGLGPGGAAHRTPLAAAAVRRAEVVVGYDRYLQQAEDLIGPHHWVVPSPLGHELDRARIVLEHAAGGRRVALVCSGDAGVYAMASPTLEIAGEPAFADVAVTVVPGVTASLAAAAAVGVPLGHDHVAISLSDLLTPWEVIEARVTAAAAADLVVAFYNPRSAGRTWQLDRALDILRAKRPPTTPVGVVTDAGREGETVAHVTLADVDVDAVGMTTCVIVGASTSTMRHGRMVTPRGYPR